MTLRYLWTSYAGTPSQYTEGGPITLGVSFVPSVDGMAKGIRWYRGATGSGLLPQRLALWSRTSGNKIDEIVAPTDNGIVGWKEYLFATPRPLAQGATYSITFDLAANQTCWRQAVGGFPTPDVNLAFSGNARAYHASAQNVFPNSVDNTNANLIDIVFDDAGTSPPPATPAGVTDVDAVMLSWLANGAGNDHLTALPNATYTAITDTSTGLPAINEAIADLSETVLKTDSAVLGEITGKLDAVDTALVNALGPAGSLALGSLRTFLNGLKTSADDTLALAAKIRGQATIQPGTPASGWTLVDTGDFDGPFLIDQEADRVTVNIVTWGADRKVNVFGGLTFFTEPMWWVPLRGGSIAGRYGTFMAAAQDLADPLGRMGGVYVKVPPDAVGTWEVWRYV